MLTLKDLQQNGWESGINQVVMADCLEAMKLIPDKSIDLILTDPPYGIGIASNPFRQKFEKKEWDNAPITEDFIREIFRISKEQIIWGGNYFELPPSQGFLIWDKVQPEDFSSAMVEFAWVSKQMPAKMYRQRVVSMEKFHPTTKPVDMMRWCLNLFPEARLICDPFMGSWTTARACKDLGRNFIGFELEEDYCKVGEERLRQGNLF